MTETKRSMVSRLRSEGRREFDNIIRQRARPATIVSDNGTEFTSNAILASADEVGVGWHYVAPGKPQQTASPRASMAACATWQLCAPGDCH